MIQHRIYNCLRIAAGRTLGFGLLLLSILCPQVLSAQVNTSQTILLGRSALFYDDYTTAIHYFSAAISAKPYLAEAYYYRAYAKFSLDEYESAVDDLDHAINFNPFHIEYYQLRGLNRIHTTDYQGAIEDYTRVLAENPEDQSAHYNRVLCRLELKDYMTASDELDVILSKWPTLSRAYLIKGQTCLTLGDTLSGERWVDSLLFINQREPVAWAFKARQHYRRHEFKACDSCFTQALKYDMGNADYYLERAQARHSLSRYNDALADYTRVIELQPRHFVAHYNRGIIRAFVGDDNQALEDFDFVINVEPDNTLAIYNRAELRRNTGDYRGAIADYTTLIKEFPNFIYGYNQRAECYRHIGATGLAAKDETRVMKADLDLAYGTARPKSVQKMRRRSDADLAQYDQIIEEVPDSTESFLSELTGVSGTHSSDRVFLPIYQLAGEYYTVEGGSKSIYASDPQVAALIRKAQEQIVADNHPAALKLLREGVEKGIADAVLYYNLGCLEAEYGTLENAINDFSMAIDADPLMAEAYYNKAVIFLLQSEENEAAPLLSKAGELGILRAYTLLKQSKKKSKN